MGRCARGRVVIASGSRNAARVLRVGEILRDGPAPAALQFRSDVADDRDIPGEDRRTVVERLVEKGLDGAPGIGKPLSRRARQTRRSLEGYFQAGLRPRWMDRVVEIEQGIASEKRRLADDHRRLRAACGSDDAAFAARWREHASTRRFDDLNDLIRQHNDWFPMERDLPVDVRTGDYVRLNGRSYRKRELDEAWVLEHFPAELTDPIPEDSNRPR